MEMILDSRLACRLVDIPIDLPTGSDDGTGRHDETDDNGDEPVDPETPQWLFDLVNLPLQFTVDVCASQGNTKVPTKFYTKEQDGLLQSWLLDRVWCNPPFCEIRKWLEKIVASDAELVMALLPASMNAKWWLELVQPHATLILIPQGGRLVFGDYDHPIPSDVVLVLFGKNANWAVDALAPHCADHLSPVRYDEVGKRLGTLQTTTLLLEPRAVVATPPAKRFHLSPPELIALLDRLFPDGWSDMCPHPLPEGFDSLAMERWLITKPGYLNPPFHPKDELHGRGPAAFVRKMIEQHELLDISMAIAMPTWESINLLLAAGAIPIPLGRLPWRDVETGEPSPHPTHSTLFVLPSKDFIMPKLDQPDSGPANR